MQPHVLKYYIRHIKENIIICSLSVSPPSPYLYFSLSFLATSLFVIAVFLFILIPSIRLVLSIQFSLRWGTENG